MNEETLPQKIWNGVHLEEEEKEDLEIHGCNENEGNGIKNMEWIDREKWKRKLTLRL